MNRFKTSWFAFQCSLKVMGANKTLFVFPAVTAVLTCVIALFFFAPIVLRPTGHPVASLDHWKAVGSSLVVERTSAELDKEGRPKQELALSHTAMGYLTVLYFLSMFLATFFNVAFFHAILNAFQGVPVSVAESMRFAGTKVKAILFWSLLAGVVGFLIRKLEERASFIGKIVIGMIGLAWSVASVFAIPAIVTSDATNPLELLRTSSGVIRKTWGEMLIGYAGMQFGSVISAGVSVSLIAVFGFLGVKLGSFAVFGAGVALWLLWITVFSYLVSVAGSVYQGALFVFASQGTVPAPFTKEMLDLGWKTKTG